jgi:transcription elongation factor S-II
MKKNAELRENIIMGTTSADDLMTMTPEQLASAEKAKERAEQVKKIQDSKRLDWEQANEDKINEMCGIKGDLLSASLFTCSRCKSTKTTSTQKQTRSADEPMTVFVLCMNCGKRWKC